MPISYLTLQQALNIHEKTIELSGGGTTSILDIGSLEATLEFIKNDDYYPNFEVKLTYLIFSVNRNHTFQDGNKRLSISLGAQFLLSNGYLYCIKRFFLEMENISYHLAAGRINKELLQKLIHSILINESDYPEDIKLEYTLACANGQIGFSE
ncbi:type II toxin-antitoxin system death-on-curing family toxin [Butyricimonas virosa]|uniref:type II toxin-antitoxin system death-on-curing family toxin n=1 Tax=Butyricimonas virosa TaxID=544645 RepID=UPI0032C1B139|nr:type II toxin-antitoxin system death-on-curing family toxin [Butyricimonas virosa]